MKTFLFITLLLSPTCTLVVHGQALVMIQDQLTNPPIQLDSLLKLPSYKYIDGDTLVLRYQSIDYVEPKQDNRGYSFKRGYQVYYHSKGDQLITLTRKQYWALLKRLEELEKKTKN